MKIKTSELTDTALDRAVGMALQLPASYWSEGKCAAFSTDWSHGGPIIDREGITVSKTRHGFWEAYFRTHDERESYQTDPTPLIAAMRCYVASKLGEEVEVPDELT